MNRVKSKEIFERANKVLPGGVNSPVRSFRHLKMCPLVAESGKGSRILDADGNSYIDFCCSWGALILGHAETRVIEGVWDQMQKGTSFGTTTEIEEKMAGKITDLVPSIEKIRFVNSGTEAVMTAIRLARGVTERAKIVKFSGHYHGHLDPLLVQAGSGVAKINPMATSKGVNLNTLADTICLPFNDFGSLQSLFESEKASEIAAVILEPIAANMGVVSPQKGFLELLREGTQRIGALLVFDEVITGFRIGLQGAQGYYGIKPDLTCLGKVIGGGFPVAAVGGKAEYLDYLAPNGPVYQAGTLSGNPVAMRGGLETLRMIEKKGFYEELNRKADAMLHPLKLALAKKNACLQQAGSMFTIFFGVNKVDSKEDLRNLDEEKFIQFFQYLFERGIYISPSSHEACFLSSAHNDAEIEYTVQSMIQFIEKYV